MTYQIKNYEKNAIFKIKLKKLFLKHNMLNYAKYIHA